MAIVEPIEFHKKAGEIVLPYGYKPYSRRNALIFRKDVKFGWVGLSFRIVEKFDQLETALHYYNPAIYEISRHSLRIEGGELARWFIGGNQLYLPDISNIWNIKLDEKQSTQWHAKNILRNFRRSAPFFEELCCDHERILCHLTINDVFSTQLLWQANARICHAIALSIFLHHSNIIVSIFSNYSETLSIQEGRDQILSQAVDFVNKLASLKIVDQRIANDCRRFYSPELR